MEQGHESEAKVDGRQDGGFLRQPSSGRRIVQGLAATVGWLIFAYWWWIVFGRVSRTEILFTAFVISVTALITILVTALWSLHNKRLHRRRPPRTQVRSPKETYPRDTLLRTVAFAGGAERIRREALVFVQVGENRKDYRYDVPPSHGVPDVKPKAKGRRGIHRA